jgi:hypothetical protein
LAGSKSKAHFSYRVVDKGKGFETAPLETASDAPKTAALPAPLKVAQK